MTNPLPAAGWPLAHRRSPRPATPARRVSELIRAGTGVPFAPAGKVFREWIAVPTINPELWHELLDEAVIFARASLNA